jgi:hypothetical protein
VRPPRDRQSPRPRLVLERRPRGRARPVGSRSTVTFRSRRAPQRRDRPRRASSLVPAVPQHKKALAPHSAPAVADPTLDQHRRQVQERARQRVQGRGPSLVELPHLEPPVDLEVRPGSEAPPRRRPKALALQRDRVPEVESRARGRSRRRPEVEAAVQAPDPGRPRDRGQEPGNRAPGQGREGQALAEHPANRQRSGRGRSGSPRRERASPSHRTTRP